MKKLLFAALLVILSREAQSQGFLTDVATARAYNNTNITIPTCFHCVTHTMHGYIVDTTLGLMARLYSVMSGASGLNGVLSLSNIDTAQQIIGVNSSFAQTMLLDPAFEGNFVFGNTSTYNVQMQAGSLFCRNGTTPVISLLGGGTYGILTQRSATGNNWFIAPSALTGARSALWPDEGTGIGVPSTVMLHTSKDRVIINNALGVQVNDGSGNSGNYTAVSHVYQDALGNQLSSQLISGVGQYQYVNSIGNLTQLVYDNPTGANQYHIPDKGGAIDTFAMLSDIALSASSIIDSQNLAVLALDTVVSYAVGTTSQSFFAGVNIEITSSGTFSFSTYVAYQDLGGNARTIPFFFSLPASTILTTTLTDASGAISYDGQVQHIWCKANTKVYIVTAGTFTAVHYNIKGVMTKN